MPPPPPAPRPAPPGDGRARPGPGGAPEPVGAAGRARAALLALAAASAAAGCQVPASELDGVFDDGDGRRVHCALGLDTVAGTTRASVEAGLDRARDRGEIFEVYAHAPGRTVPVEVLAHLLAGAADRGLPFVTYAQVAAGVAARPAVALSFDDADVDAWTSVRGLLRDGGARVTFFVTRYARLSAAQRDGLRALAGDGHDVEAHAVAHLRGPDYVEARGLAAYLEDEVQPSIDLLRADGYPVVAYAYPFGARTRETDEAILARVPLVRSLAFSYGGPIESPCPR